MTHRKINHTAVVSRESVTNKLMDKRTVLNRGSTWALRDLRRIYRIPACVGSCLSYFITRLHITHITAYRATTERDIDLNVMIKTSHFHRLLVEMNRDNLVKVLLSRRQMYNRRARLTCNNYTTLKTRENNLRLGYNETNGGCSEHTVSGEERTYCLRKWRKCEGINEVTIMTSLANYEYLH